MFFIGRGDLRSPAGVHRTPLRLWRFESAHGFASVGNLYPKMHFAGSNLSRDRKCPKCIYKISHLASKSRHRRVYHPQLVAVYHQCEALYIIKPQEDARYRVMIYKGGIAALDDIESYNAFVNLSGIQNNRCDFCHPRKNIIVLCLHR